MKTYEIKLTFDASFIVTADNESQAIEEAIERARDNYGNEVADYGNFEKMTFERITNE